MFGHRREADENGTRANDYRGKPNTSERLAESSRAAVFQFSNKSVVEHNFLGNELCVTIQVTLYIYIYIYQQ